MEKKIIAVNERAFQEVLKNIPETISSFIEVNPDKARPSWTFRLLNYIFNSRILDFLGQGMTSQEMEELAQMDAADKYNSSYDKQIEIGKFIADITKYITSSKEPISGIDIIKSEIGNVRARVLLSSGIEVIIEKYMKNPPSSVSVILLDGNEYFLPVYKKVASKEVDILLELLEDQLKNNGALKMDLPVPELLEKKEDTISLLNKINSRLEKFPNDKHLLKTKASLLFKLEQYKDTLSLITTSFSSEINSEKENPIKTLKKDCEFRLKHLEKTYSPEYIKHVMSKYLYDQLLLFHPDVQHYKVVAFLRAIRD